MTPGALCIAHGRVAGFGWTVMGTVLTLAVALPLGISCQDGRSRGRD